MKELIIDLTGKLGLADNFYGDLAMSTPYPQMRYGAKDGEMVHGLFNPYIFDGYLAPVFTNESTITVDTDAITPVVFTSVEYDIKNTATFWAGNDEYIYHGGYNDVTLIDGLTLAAGSKINDLQMYTKNTEDSLFYSYTKDEFISEADFVLRSDWVSAGVTLNAVGRTAPTKIFSVVKDETGTTVTTDPFQYVGGQTKRGFVFVSVTGQTVSTAKMGGSNMTLVSSTTERLKGNTVNIYIYMTPSLGDTEESIEIVNTGSARTVISAVFYNSVDTASPYADVVFTRGLGMKSYSQFSSDTDRRGVEFILSGGSVFNVTTLTASTTYNPAAQTGSNGTAVFLSPDGTKMYVDGSPASTTFVYQYTLSTPYNPSTATYDTKSLNIETQVTGAAESLHFNSAGTRMYAKRPNSSVVYQYTLSTPWDVSTGTYGGSITLSTLSSELLTSTSMGVTVSNDGLELYLCSATSLSDNSAYIYQYTLGTAYDITTATYTGRYQIEIDDDYARSIDISDDNKSLIITIINDNHVYAYDFHPLFPKDITKITPSYSGTTLQVGDFGSSQLSPKYRYGGTAIYSRDNSNDDVKTFTLEASTTPSIITKNQQIYYDEKETLTYSVSVFDNMFGVDVGTLIYVLGLADGEEFPSDKTWLSLTQGINLKSNSRYNFLRTADNGFMYLFTGNTVHVIDGGYTGGIDGLFTENVVVFPDNFIASDAVDFKGNMFIAIHEYPVQQTFNTKAFFSGSCGVYVWDRISSEFGSVDYIRLPGVREIKKLFISPDSTLKAIVISDTGMTELREYGYGDSGGAGFKIKKSLGLGAFPNTPDGLINIDDKTVWLSNSGQLFCEKSNIITKLHQFKAATVSDSEISNILSGAIFLTSDFYNTSTTRQYNPRIHVSFNDADTIKNLCVAPFTISDGSVAEQTIQTGSVYSPVKVLPVTSTVKSLRIYNYPTTTGTGEIAKVKLYFNQSSTATFPAGMTKSVFAEDAKRGYVDFEINSSYIHAIQIEIEWVTPYTMSLASTYLPFMAVVAYDETTTKSKNNPSV